MRRFLRNIIIVLLWLGLWQLVSMITGLEILLPSPVHVLYSWISMLGEKEYYMTIFYTAISIGRGFFPALLSGIVLGTVAAKSRLFADVLKPALVFMQSMPLAAFIVLLLMWFGSKNVASYITYMVVFPIAYYATEDGIHKTCSELLEMAVVFRLNWCKRVRYIYMPSVIAYLQSNLKTALGMCWKAGISAEVIGLAQNTIGSEIYYAKLYLMANELFVWSATIICISFVFEKAILALLKLVSKITIIV